MVFCNLWTGQSWLRAVGCTLNVTRKTSLIENNAVVYSQTTALRTDLLTSHLENVCHYIHLANIVVMNTDTNLAMMILYI